MTAQNSYRNVINDIHQLAQSVAVWHESPDMSIQKLNQSYGPLYELLG